MPKSRFILALGSLVALGPGCKPFPSHQDKENALVNVVALPPSPTFDELARFLATRADGIVLEGDAGSRALVSPQLQGRLFTFKVGSIESTGFVNTEAIARGEVDPRFNNFGAADRFWLYPEAGQFGLYFDPGVELDRNLWKVPPDLDRGGWTVTEQDSAQVALQRNIEVCNYVGTRFKVRAERKVSMMRAASLPAELGIKLPAGVAHAGAVTRNVITNAGAAAWSTATGLIGIWILGMFQPSDTAAIIAPFRPGSDRDLGPAFNDEYFGKVSVDSPERIKVLGNAVVLRADARREGKLGVSQQRSTGLAGSIDFERNLLTVVKFDLPLVPERYGNSTWIKNQAEPFKGDAFQTYNAGPADPGSNQRAAAPFYELESASPVRPLAPGESLTHHHATHHFHGELSRLNTIARQLLGVDLEAVREALKI